MFFLQAEKYLAVQFDGCSALVASGSCLKRSGLINDSSVGAPSPKWPCDIAHMIVHPDNLDKMFFQNQRTPPKINIEPENDDLEDDFPLPGVHSQVPC